LFGQRVVDECAGAGLAAGEVFELIGGAVGRIELDVEPGEFVAWGGRLLVHGHDVGEREAEEAIVFARDGQEGFGEIVEVIFLHLPERGEVGFGRDMDLVRVAGEEGDDGDEGIVLPDETRALGLEAIRMGRGGIEAAFEGEPILHERAGVLVEVAAFGFELGFGDGRDERVGVDLAVRVKEGDADFLALVFEDENVFDFGALAQGQVAFLPDPGELAGLGIGKLGEGGIVPVGVADDFADSGAWADGDEAGAFDGGMLGVRAEGRESVFEDGDVVGFERDFGGESAGLGGTERAEVGRRQEGSFLAVRGGDHPLIEERMVAKLGHGRSGCTRSDL